MITQVQQVSAGTALQAVVSALEHVPCGFPSPAQDYWTGDIDLAQKLIPNTASTYLLTVSGESMIGAGIHDGDYVLVDRSITARSGHIIVGVIDGELTVKRLMITGDRVSLRAEHPSYPVLHVHQLAEFQVWGVVTWVLHQADGAL